MTRPGGELTTYRARGGHRQRLIHGYALALDHVQTNRRIQTKRVTCLNAFLYAYAGVVDLTLVRHLW